MSLHLDPGASEPERQRSLGAELKESAVRTFVPVLIPLAAMWVLWLVNGMTGNWLNITLGLRPRDLDGLSGILFMPLLHGGLTHGFSVSHILGNTFSWLVLGGMVSLLTRRFTFVMTGIWLLSGIILWLIGTPWAMQPTGSYGGLHVGASGVIYGFAAFLAVYGFIARRLVAIVFAVFVIFFYGLSMLFGMLPMTAGSGVSWTGHLSGAIAGAVVAWIVTGRLREERRNRPSRSEPTEEPPPWF